MTQTQSEGTPFNSKARAVFKQTGATLLCVVKCRAKEKYILFTIEHLKYNNTLRTNKEGGHAFARCEYEFEDDCICINRWRF